MRMHSLSSRASPCLDPGLDVERVRRVGDEPIDLITRLHFRIAIQEDRRVLGNRRTEFVQMLQVDR